MRKLITLLLIAALLLPALALADLPDISGLSYDELVQLKEQINLAMWNSQEWQEVTVPVGIYVVGKDIPAGYWHIASKEYSYTMIWYFEKLDAYGTGPDVVNGYMYNVQVHNLGPDDIVSADIDMKEGMYFMTDTDAVIFTPYSGKPDLGFK